MSNAKVSPVKAVELKITVAKTEAKDSTEGKKKKKQKPDVSKKLKITGDSNWMALQKSMGKSKKSKNSKKRKAKTEIDVESSKPEKLQKLDESVDCTIISDKTDGQTETKTDTETGTKTDMETEKPTETSPANASNNIVKTAAELMKLLDPETSKSSKVATAVDYDQLEDLSIEDIEAGFGYEMAWNVAKRRKTKEAQFYKKKFLDADEAKARDNPDFKASTSEDFNDKMIKTTKDDINLTKFLGMDCEMVGVGFKGKKSILARVSICNQFGKCVYDKHVAPDVKVVDFRTAVSGVRPSDLLETNGALPFEIIQMECREIFRNRIVVGHQLNSDFSVLKIKHPKVNIRDTAKYFVETYGRTPSLKLLVRDFLEVGFQSGEHSSVQDAQATMRIYTMHKKKWERELVAEKKSLKTGEKLNKRMFVGNNNQKPKSHYQKAVEEEKEKIIEGRKKEDAKLKEDKSIPRGFAPDDDGGDWLD
jgi:RNA exonuclease 4